MRNEVHGSSPSSAAWGVEAFYASALGATTRRTLRTRLRAMWPELAGQEVLGLGHAGPYLRLWRRRAARLVAASPAALRPLRPWPPDGPNATALVETEHLPFPDLSFDAVLMVHGLEAAEDTRRTLREAWRVLRPEGRLLAVVPNRRSIWAHLESTPFGHGHPWSASQITGLLERGLFEVMRREVALFIPPFRGRPLLRGARAWEAAGRAVAPRFAGVVLVEARKSVSGIIPPAGLAARTRRAFAPAPAGLRSGLLGGGAPVGRRRALPSSGPPPTRSLRPLDPPS